LKKREKSRKHFPSEGGEWGTLLNGGKKESFPGEAEKKRKRSFDGGTSPKGKSPPP